MKSLQRLPIVLLALGFQVPLVAQTPPGSRLASRPLTYGTSAITYVEVPAAEFRSSDSGRTYTSDSGGWGPLWGTNNGGVGIGFTAGLHLPSGARPVYLELDSIDTNATKTVYGSLVECDLFSENCVPHPAAGGGPGDCLVSGFICSGTAFSGGETLNWGNLSPDSITIDNLERSYRLYAATFATDGTLKIGGMIVGYVLQVSPAPATATFLDVPTSSPQFKFVEALVAAGITAGCGGGNYCPNQAITRGQMAVFLATALGLQFH